MSCHLKKIWDVINKMTPDRIELMEMLFKEDLDIKDIAEKKKVSLQSVYQMLRRTIETLREELEKKGIKE